MATLERFRNSLQAAAPFDVIEGADRFAEIMGNADLELLLPKSAPRTSWPEKVAEGAITQEMAEGDDPIFLSPSAVRLMAVIRDKTGNQAAHVLFRDQVELLHFTRPRLGHDFVVIPDDLRVGSGYVGYPLPGGYALSSKVDQTDTPIYVLTRELHTRGPKTNTRTVDRDSIQEGGLLTREELMQSGHLSRIRVHFNGRSLRGTTPPIAGAQYAWIPYSRSPWQSNSGGNSIVDTADVFEKAAFTQIGGLILTPGRQARPHMEGTWFIES